MTEPLTDRPSAHTTPVARRSPLRYLDWELPDPAGLPIGQVRPIRDEIDRRVRDLLAELTATTTERADR